MNKTTKFILSPNHMHSTLGKLKRLGEKSSAYIAVEIILNFMNKLINKAKTV